MAKARAASKPPSEPVHDDRWRIPDALWERIESLLPPRPPHRLGGHNPRVDDRRAMDAIFFVLRTGCQWNALNATGICSSSSAHRRFQEWTAAGVFVNLWAMGLQEYDELKGLDWEWLAMDGAMTKAPLGGERTGRNPTDRGKLGTKRSLLTEANGIPVGLAVEGANRHDKKVAEATLESIPVERPEPTEESPQGMSSTFIAVLKPMPSWPPMRFSAGTRTLSKITSAVCEPRWPIFRSGLPTVKPGRIALDDECRDAAGVLRFADRCAP